jgi:hypothetical protein
METDADRSAAASLAGRLYIFVAFDWGDEIDLDAARRLAPAAVLELSRRPRTPSSITYRPPPLRFQLAAGPLPGLEALQVEEVEATVFDFAAVSVTLRTSFRMPLAELRTIAGKLSDRPSADALVRAARAAVTPLHQKLLPAVSRPAWADDLCEEYFVFQFQPGEPLRPDELLGPLAGGLAGLVRLEDQVLSESEVAEATRLHLRYGADDLFVADWPAAVLLDREEECGETLRTIEFANLQLLEYRHIDDRLDGLLARASRLAGRASRAHLPYWGGQHKPLRAIGEWKVEATGLFERTGNALKLVGDQYLARVYRQLALRFHLRDWEKSIRRKLEVIESVYDTVQDKTVTFRMEFLELVIIILIAVEIVLSLLRH